MQKGQDLSAGMILTSVMSTVCIKWTCGALTVYSPEPRPACVLVSTTGTNQLCFLWLLLYLLWMAVSYQSSGLVQWSERVARVLLLLVTLVQGK